MARRILLSLVLLVVVLAIGGYALAWHPAIAPVPAPQRADFAPSQVARGAELAAIGDCVVCHTVPGGRPYAGGRGVPTPFGVVYATNITPDPATGIGTWSEAAFRRAMRDGIDQAGRHLYPVLPYPHFTRATDADIGALYTYMMTRTPVRQQDPGNKLPFPLNQRVLLAGWNLLFLHPGPWQPDPAHDATWNRGEYLVEAVGHCGACHTPHNALGAEQGGRRFAGGEAEGWYAPPLQAGSPAPVEWDVAGLTAYLHGGYDAKHGAAAGPMTAVTEELGRVPEADVRAIATFIASEMPKGVPTRVPPARQAPGNTEAAALFTGACSSCHAADAPMTRAGAPPLSASTSVHEPTSAGVVQAILHGIPWREGRAAPYMPQFADSLTDQQVAQLATYVRARFGGRSETAVTADDVAKARRGEGS